MKYTGLDKPDQHQSPAETNQVLWQSIVFIGLLVLAVLNGMRV
jgi:hypothetical protein